MSQAPSNQQELTTLSDEQLWAIVSKQETFSSTNQPDLESFIDAYDQYVLLRSKALLLLKQRGYNVEQYLKLAQTNL